MTIKPITNLVTIELINNATEFDSICHFQTFIPVIDNIELTANRQLRVSADTKIYKKTEVHFDIFAKYGEDQIFSISGIYPIEHSAVNIEFEYPGLEAKEIGRVWNTTNGIDEEDNTLKDFQGSKITLPSNISFQDCRFRCRVNIFTKVGVFDLRYPKPNQHTGIHGPWSEIWKPS